MSDHKDPWVRLDSHTCAMVVPGGLVIQAMESKWGNSDYAVTRSLCYVPCNGIDAGLWLAANRESS